MVIAGPFDYQGFQNSPSARGVLISWLVLVIMLPLLVRVFRSETLSGHITATLALISFVPTTTLIAHDPRYSAAFVLLISVYWFLLLLACLVLPPIRPFNRPLRSEVPHVFATAALCAVVLFISWRYTDFRLHFGLFDVYDLRAEARMFEVPTFLGYLATIADNALPVLLAFYLRRRWLLVAAAVSVVILFNFGISGTKQVLFLLVFALASIFVRENAQLNRKILAALAIVVVLCVVEKQMLDTIFVGTLSIYRVFFIPAQLHWVHYEFFQTNELLYLTQSALRFFFESPYKENIQFLLGEYYIGHFSARANNGLFSDGYMNFGAPSVLFYPIITVVVLKLMEGAARGLSSNVRLMLTITLSFVMLNLPLPTALLSAGMAVMVVLLATLPRAGSAPHLATSTVT